MKKIFAIIISLVFAILISFGISYFSENTTKFLANITNTTSLVKQDVISYGNYEKTYNKIYYKDKLVGVANNINNIYDLISKKSNKYKNQFPDSELGLCDDIYIVEEKTFASFENVDDQIVDYLDENNLLGIKTTAIEFSTDDGVYDIIYVKNIDDFNEAKNMFLLNFVSEETLDKLNNKEPISGPTEYGSVEKNVSILESISYKTSTVYPESIFKNVNDIYNYLCYGRNNKESRYVIKEGDTIQSIAYYNGFWPKHLVMINNDQLKTENQVLVPGTELNIAYFSSPITVRVVKEELSMQLVSPDAPIYDTDPNLMPGEVQVINEEIIGMENVLDEQIWLNGILQKKDDDEHISVNVIQKPQQGRYVVSELYKAEVLQNKLIGTGNYIWPLDNPYITCDYGGYAGHTGTDFVNKYLDYCPIYAIDHGTVDDIGWKDDMGYYIIINHNNGIRTFYMHLYEYPKLLLGDNVVRGQIIGTEGNTGMSEGAHLHLTFEVDDERVNSCKYLPCDLIR